jgi:hypothetical protein
LRWLEFTETRAIMVVSNEGFAHWAKPSTAALKSGRYIRTRETVFELPAQAFAARRDYSDAARTGVTQQAGVWFPEPVHEMCFRSERYDQEISVLQFEADGPRFQEEEKESDVFDHFARNGRLELATSRVSHGLSKLAIPEFVLKDLTHLRQTKSALIAMPRNGPAAPRPAIMSRGTAGDSRLTAHLKDLTATVGPSPFAISAQRIPCVEGVRGMGNGLPSLLDCLFEGRETGSPRAARAVGRGLHSALGLASPRQKH